MKKKLSGYLCFLLAMILLCVSFAACGGEGEKQTEAPTKEAESATLDDRYDEYGYLKDSLPEDLNFNKSMLVLGWEEERTSFYVKEEELGQDRVNDTVYERNATVEERLGVELEFILTPGNWSNRANFIKKIESAHNTGIVYDSIVAYNLIPYQLAQSGYVQNLYDSKYLDFSAPWWPESFIKEVLYKDQIFGVTAIGGKATIDNVHCMFFNNTLIDTYQMESPYDLVKNNQWTLDKVNEMITDTYNDLNTNGKNDGADFYGFCACGTQPKIDAWLYAMGYRMSEVNGDGDLVSLLDTPKMEEYLSYITTIFANPSIYLFDDTHPTMFKEQRCVFYMTSFRATGAIKDDKIDYGVAPIPKKTTEQERYYTHIANTYDTWCVPVTVADLDPSSALLECLGSEAYRQVMPVYYEETLKLRYAPDERLADMYDLILSSITFDFSYLYTCVFATNPKGIIQNIITNPAVYSWSSQHQTYAETWRGEFAKILDAYDSER